MTGHACPRCGRRTAGEPGTEHRVPCRCGAGASSARLTEDEQRAARTAEIAAAEDFDPLRIRPYVTLTDHAGARGDGSGGPRPGSGTREGAATGGWEGAGPSGTRDDAASPAWEGTATGTGPAAPDAAGNPADPGAVASTMPLFLGGDGPKGGVGAAPDAGGTVPDGSRRRTAGATPVFAPDPVRPRRRSPLGALAVGAAVAAVVGTAAFAGGLFGGDDGGNEALPEATTSVPDTEDEPAASVAPSPSASAAPPRTHSPSATPSASPSASASPTRSRDPEPTATATASAPPATGASPSPDAGAPSAAPPDGPPPALAPSSLRPGDRGPEVAELQTRLRTVGEWLYSGPVDGSSYSDQVAHSVAIYQSYKAIQGDPIGVYGPNTRRALEQETNGNGRHRAH
ncbi:MULTISPECIES: peptidoglycan-binding domain-containing protein [Streptomyces]|nr:peptidoglycan-binding protein [Streptomyces griseus]SEE59030.1 Putative peptidoglycan binding domain-containing protein [Streptomyces griseus]SQA26038.1 peptidodoglycan-binding membrane protein [Streptomyces griseus]